MHRASLSICCLYKRSIWAIRFLTDDVGFLVQWPRIFSIVPLSLEMQRVSRHFRMTVAYFCFPSPTHLIKISQIKLKCYLSFIKAVSAGRKAECTRSITSTLTLHHWLLHSIHQWIVEPYSTEGKGRASAVVSSCKLNTAATNQELRTKIIKNESLL